MTILNKKYYNIFLVELAFYLSIITLSLIPWMEFINSNYKELDNIINDNFLFLIVLYFVFISLIYLITKLIFKKENNLYHICFVAISVWIFFQFNLIKSILNNLLSGNYIWHFSSEISLFLVLSLILLFYFLNKNKNWRLFILFFLIFNFIYLNITLFPKLKSFYFENKMNIEEKKSLKQNSKNINRPNIYFFLIDAMKPLNEFEDFYKLKLNDFRNIYQKYNYVNYNNATNLYNWTEPVMTGFFLLEEHIYTEETKDLKKKDKILKSHIIKTFPTILKKDYSPKLLEVLRELGYQFKWIGNYSQNCSYTNYRYCLNNKKKDYIDIYTLQAFLNKSPIIQVFDNLIQIEFIQDNFDLKILHSNSIKEIDNFIISNKEFISDISPTFYFIHEVETHEPYFVDSECRNKRFPGNFNLEGYRNSYLCVIKKISKVIDTINEHDPDSIVIFQSDHNWRMSTKSESEFGNRNNIFSLIKNNTICKKTMPNNPNNLNTIKYFIDCLNETK